MATRKESLGIPLGYPGDMDAPGCMLYFFLGRLDIDEVTLKIMTDSLRWHGRSELFTMGAKRLFRFPENS